MADFTSDDATSLDHLDGLYVPANERELRRVQRQGEDLDRQVRAWAESVIRVLPRGLPINSHEVYVLSLFVRPPTGGPGGRRDHPLRPLAAPGLRD